MSTRIYASACALLLLVSHASAQEADYVETWNFWEAVSYLHDNYYDAEAVKNIDERLIADYIDRDKQIEAVFSGLKNPWTQYFSPTAMWTHRHPDHVSAGLGVETSKTEDPVINLVMFGTPAEKAGLERRDRLVKANGNTLKGLSNSDVYDVLSAKPGERIDIEYTRGSRNFHTWLVFTAGQDLVEARLLSNNIAYIHIRDFSSADMPKVFAQKFARLYIASGGDIRGIVLDMRGNPGGYMVQCYKLMGAFIEKGEVGIWTRRSEKHIEKATPYVEALLKADPETQAVAAKVQRALFDLPLVELTNGSTMSAAEATTAGLKDSGRATLVGEKTWGKGMHYNTYLLDTGGMVTVVSGKFMGPKGADHHGLGIEPNRFVKDLRDVKGDAPLAVALSILVPAPAPTVQPTTPFPWGLYTVSSGSLLFVIVVLLWRRRNRQRQEALLQKLVEIVTRREEASHEPETYYGTDGEVDWSVIVNPRVSRQRRGTVHQLHIVEKVVLPYSHFFSGSPCHQCNEVMKDGAPVVEVVLDGTTYYCCESCADNIKQNAGLAHSCHAV